MSIWANHLLTTASRFCPISENTPAQPSRPSEGTDRWCESSALVQIETPLDRTPESPNIFPTWIRWTLRFQHTAQRRSDPKNLNVIKSIVYKESKLTMWSTCRFQPLSKGAAASPIRPSRRWGWRPRRRGWFHSYFEVLNPPRLTLHCPFYRIAQDFKFNDTNTCAVYRYAARGAIVLI